MASSTAEALVQRLHEMRTDLNARGQAFSLGFIALQAQAERGPISTEALEEVQNLAGSVNGQPFSGVRNRAYYFAGEEVPERVGGNAFGNLPFKGLLRGVELARTPGAKDEDELLCVVIDPLSASDNPVIQKSAYFQYDRWVTYLPQGDVVDSRLWIPAGGIRNLGINTNYIGSHVMNVLEADRSWSEVLELFPEEAVDAIK